LLIDAVAIDPGWAVKAGMAGPTMIPLPSASDLFFFLRDGCYYTAGRALAELTRRRRRRRQRREERRVRASERRDGGREKSSGKLHISSMSSNKQARCDVAWPRYRMADSGRALCCATTWGAGRDDLRQWWWYPGCTILGGSDKLYHPQGPATARLRGAAT
jgi:hypothetical protein